jgi:hypothetical protein
MNLKDIAKIKNTSTSEIVDYLKWKGVTIQDTVMKYSKNQ